MFETVFIPYAHLSTEPLPLRLCNNSVLASIRLTCSHGVACELTLHNSFKFGDGGTVAVVGVGSVFEVMYRDSLTEVRIGRRIVVWDA